MKYMMKIHANVKSKLKGKIVDPHTADVESDTTVSRCWRSSYNASIISFHKLFVYLLTLGTAEQTQIKGWDKLSSRW